VREVEVRLRSPCVATLAAIAAISRIGAMPAHSAEVTTDKPAVVAPEDKALVYFVRSKRPGKSLSTFLYIDDEFVGVLEDNSFTYAFVEEGRRELWTFPTLELPKLLKAMPNPFLPGWDPWEGSGFEATRGRTYYFWFDDPRDTQDTHVRLDEEEGAKWIDKVKFYSSPTREESRISAQHLSTRGAKTIEWLEQAHAETHEYSTPEMPADRAGFIRVDANSEVHLELVQNVMTRYGSTDATGDDVWFRVTRDSVSAGVVWLREGTLVRGILSHVKDRRSSTQGGTLDVAIPAVVAVDGTVVPTQGEIRDQGGKASGPGVARILLTAVHVGFALLGGDTGGPGRRAGKDAYLLLGSTTTIYTRAPVWISPASATAASEEQTLQPPALRLRAPTSTLVKAPENVHVKVQFVGRPAKTRREAPELEFLLELPQRPDTVRVRSIAGQFPPVEIEVKEVKKVGRGWRCIFDWWQIVRFLPLADEDRHIALELEGVLEDGTAFVVDAAVDIKERL
jgi:hypothetical protein